MTFNYLQTNIGAGQREVDLDEAEGGQQEDADRGYFRCFRWAMCNRPSLLELANISANQGMRGRVPSINIYC